MLNSLVTRKFLNKETEFFHARQFLGSFYIKKIEFLHVKLTCPKVKFLHKQTEFLHRESDLHIFLMFELVLSWRKSVFQRESNFLSRKKKSLSGRKN